MSSAQNHDNPSVELARLAAVVQSHTDKHARSEEAVQKISEAIMLLTRLTAVQEEKFSSMEKLHIQAEHDKRKELQHINKRLDDLGEKIDRTFDEIQDSMINRDSKATEKLASLSKRVDSLEKYKWWIMGGFAAIGFILMNLTSIREALYPHVKDQSTSIKSSSNP